MPLKQTVILGLAGAAAIYAARQIPTVNNITTSAPFNNNGKMVPLIPEAFMLNPDAKHANWSALFFMIPAAGAWYLSR
jgi:hypothetical protein